MKLTSKLQNAVLLLKELDTVEPKRLADIAEKYKLSSNFLEQIGRKLRAKGIIKSQRGPGGGYILNAQPGQVDLFTISLALGKIEYKSVSESEVGSEIVDSYQTMLEAALGSIIVR